MSTNGGKAKKSRGERTVRSFAAEKTEVARYSSAVDRAFALARRRIRQSGTFMAVADFSRLASEEDWASLVSALRDSADPGRLCLMAMVDWRLTATNCQAHHPMSGPERQGGAPDAVRRTAD